ncbi:MAG TPA: toll/interleukin-1 receptor domain-containing protein [Archangium sp.]|nr:toll/interleukin-1 receptor domain-containing protein [Archangium sp.]
MLERTSSQVFISHAEEDSEFARELVRELRLQDVDPWIAEELPPGREWEVEIRRALDAASAVVLVVSQASARSKWVRAEIAHAFERQKAIFPILLEKTGDMPLLWKQLQHIDWKNPRHPPLRALAANLPKKSTAVLRQLLDAPGHTEAIRELIARNPHWLPIDRPTNPEYVYFHQVPMSGGSTLDVFAGRLDTGGPRCYLYYLGSPYSSPFMKKGKPSRELVRLLRLAAQHFHELRSPIPDNHIVSPIRSLLDRQGMKLSALENRYRSLHVRIFSGRRSHYATREHCEKAIAHWCEENNVDWRSSLELISYDRILQCARDVDVRLIMKS